jgi:lactate permease
VKSTQKPSEPSSSGKPSHALSLTLEAFAFLALIAAVIYLFKTNPATLHWTQGYNPTGSFVLSTLIAALPIVILLGAIAILRLKAHAAALAGLITALLAAMFVFHMPARLAFTTAAYGAGYGIFPIVWIILPVIFLYDLTVKTGRFSTLPTVACSCSSSPSPLDRSLREPRDSALPSPSAPPS